MTNKKQMDFLIPSNAKSRQILTDTTRTEHLVLLETPNQNVFVDPCNQANADIFRPATDCPTSTMRLPTS